MGEFLSKLNFLGGKRSRQEAREQLEDEMKDFLSFQETKELEFLELVRVSLTDGKLASDEVDMIRHFAARQKWDASYARELFNHAMSHPHHTPPMEGNAKEKLKRFVRFSVANNIEKQKLEILEEIARGKGVAKEVFREWVEEEPS